MDYYVREGNFSGVIRSFVDTGLPLVELFPSSTQDNVWNVSNIFLLDEEITHCASSTDEKLKTQLIVDVFKPLYISNYSIRSHGSKDYFMQAWTLEGSEDNKTYDIIDNRTINADLNVSGVGKYPVNDERKGYRFFRIKQTIATINGLTNMRISALDFYGTFKNKFIAFVRTPRALQYYFFVSVYLYIVIESLFGTCKMSQWIVW